MSLWPHPTMDSSILHILIPLWVGIIANLVFAFVNLSLLKSHGRFAAAWMRYSPKVLICIWIVIGLHILNSFLQRA